MTKLEIIINVNRTTATVTISPRLKRVSSFSLGVYFLRTFYPIVSLGVPVLLRRGIVRPIPDAENKGCIGQVRRAPREGRISPQPRLVAALPPGEDASRRVPTAYLFLHLNFIILFHRYGAPVRFFVLTYTTPDPRCSVARVGGGHSHAPTT